MKRSQFSFFDVIKAFIILYASEADVEWRSESIIYPGYHSIAVNGLTEFNYRDLGSGQYELKTFFGKRIASRQTYSLDEIRRLAICWLSKQQLPIKP